MKKPEHPAPSGEQWTIHGDDVGAASARATVVEVGGGLREYEAGGIAMLDPFPLDAICDGAHNMPLVPWPNRIRDGRYAFDGNEYRLDLTEPALHNAIHGFGRWRNWRRREHGAHRIVVGLRLHPQPGYPFTLDIAVEYELSAEGLTVRTTAINLGDRPCPYGCGQHPYVRCGTETIDSLALELDAAQWLQTDAQQIPVGTASVAGSPFDFRDERKIGVQKIDCAFGQLARDANGRAWARLASPTDRRVSLWADERFRYLQIYTGDTLAPARRRHGLAIEPMTCPPNAFATGEDLIRLEPGESVTTVWGIVVG